MSSLGGEPDGYKVERSLGDALNIWYWRDGGLWIVNAFMGVVCISAIVLLVLVL